MSVALPPVPFDDFLVSLETIWRKHANPPGSLHKHNVLLVTPEPTTIPNLNASQTSLPAPPPAVIEPSLVAATASQEQVIRDRLKQLLAKKTTLPTPTPPPVPPPPTVTAAHLAHTSFPPPIPAPKPVGLLSPSIDTTTNTRVSGSTYNESDGEDDFDDDVDVPMDLSPIDDANDPIIKTSRYLAPTTTFTATPQQPKQKERTPNKTAADKNKMSKAQTKKLRRTLMTEADRRANILAKTQSIPQIRSLRLLLKQHLKSVYDNKKREIGLGGTSLVDVDTPLPPQFPEILNNFSEPLLVISRSLFKADPKGRKSKRAQRLQAKQQKAKNANKKNSKPPNRGAEKGSVLLLQPDSPSKNDHLSSRKIGHNRFNQYRRSSRSRSRSRSRTRSRSRSRSRDRYATRYRSRSPSASPPSRRRQRSPASPPLKRRRSVSPQTYPKKTKYNLTETDPPPSHIGLSHLPFPQYPVLNQQGSDRTFNFVPPFDQNANTGHFSHNVHFVPKQFQ